MNESDSLIPNNKETSLCSNCRKAISVDLIYVCTSGHQICTACTSRLTRCLLCCKAISDSPHFVCKYLRLGCSMKAVYDEIKQHETDCDFKEFLCPFRLVDGSCTWFDSEINVVQHLREFHSEHLVMKNVFEGELPRRDKTWIFISFNKVFKCYVWIYEFHVDWIVKYIGPQKYSANYSYQVKLHRLENVTLYKNTSRCTGYNNMALEECLSISVKDIKDYLTKGKVFFRVKIIKNFPSVEDVRQLLQ